MHTGTRLTFFSLQHQFLFSRARTHAHIILLLTCQCQSGQSHRFSGLCTRDSSAKFCGTHGRHPQTREAVPECKKGANAETLCAAPRSSVHCSNQAFLKVDSQSSTPMVVTRCLSLAFTAALVKRVNVQTSACFREKSTRPQTQRTCSFIDAAVCFAGKRCTVPGTTEALSRVASVMIGS